MSRLVTSARTARAAASISAGPASGPSPPRAASTSSSKPACAQCRRYASTVTVNPFGRLTPASSSSASRPILAPQTLTARSGAISSTQAMASGTGSALRLPGHDPLEHGDPAGGAVHFDLVPVGDEHGGQADRGYRGDAVLAPN